MPFSRDFIKGLTYQENPLTVGIFDEYHDGFKPEPYEGVITTENLDPITTEGGDKLITETP